jgi:hypothetical protein
MNRKKDYKYQTYHINKSILTGKLRDRFFEMVLTDDVHHRKQLYRGFLVEILGLVFLINYLTECVISKA